MAARALRSGIRVGLAAVVAVGCLVGAFAPISDARAEAPFYYDPLGDHAVYDPEFYPLNRSSGLLGIMVQGWTQPDEGADQAPFDQDYVAQYRLQWVASLAPEYSLLIELKGSDRDRVIDHDYFLKSEFLYQGLEAPVYLYGGIRLPEDDEWMWYTGVESMSYRIDDAFPDIPVHVPVGFRGFGEIRYQTDEENPILRLTALAHTLHDLGIDGLTLGASWDSFFRDSEQPRWVLQGHAEYTLPRQFLRLSAILGYAVEFQGIDDQRVSLGVRADLF